MRENAQRALQGASRAEDQPPPDGDPVRAFLEASHDLLAIASISGYFTWLSPGWAKQLGRPAAALLDRPLLENVHPEDREPTLQQFGALRAARPVVRFVNRYQHADGHWVPLEWTSSAPDARGLIYCTARRVDEALAAASFEADPRFRHFEQRSGFGHWRLDLWAGQLLMSSAAAELLGLDVQPERSRSASLDELAQSLVEQGNAEAAADLEAMATAEDDVDLLWTRFRGTERERVVRMMGSVERDAFGRKLGVAGLAIDETRQVRRERRLDARAAAAEDAAARLGSLLRLSESSTHGFSDLYEKYAAVGRDYTGLAGGGVYTLLGRELQPSPPRSEVLDPEIRRQLLRSISDAVPIYWSNAEPGAARKVLLAAPIRAQYTLRGVLAFFGDPNGARGAADLDFVVMAATALGGAIETLEASRRSRYQQSLFEGLFSQTPDGIFLEDVSQRRVLMVNDALCRMLGLGRDEIVGRVSASLFDRSEDFEATAPPQTKRGALAPVELTLLGAGGRRVPVELVSTVICDDRDRPLAVMQHARDISGRQAMERMKQEFVAVASHELRTPLTATLGAVGLLRESTRAMPADTRELIDLAERSGRRLETLIDDILDIQRLDACALPMHRRRHDLRAIAHDALQLGAVHAGQYDVTLRLEPGDPVWVDVDGRRVGRVLTNLLSNATKHAPEGSVVTVRVVREGRLAVCSVQDAGPGVPVEFRPRVFDKFTQADASSTRRTSGSGLGLAISKAIVDQHDGDIDFECPPGGGTTFRFRLPLAPEDEEEAAT